MKRVWILVLIVIIILGIIFIPRIFFNKGDDNLSFKILEENQIPEDIVNMLPKYQDKERALSCEVDEEIYVIVTRGEKRTAGYGVTIEKIEKVKTDDEVEFIVYAKYKDPKPEEIVPQVITYPTVVAKLEVDSLPDKIKLQTEYME
ncbi:MAG: protease complex subunit PrcB family protein [Firmicutes bacterium]|nr:protease complex subunit PrcB family protein [Bacillota bacterium]